MNKLKQLIRFIKKYLGEIMLVIGTGLFIRSIFNFSFTTVGGDCKFNLDLSCHSMVEKAYYYSPNTLMGISIGVMLIVIGILIIRKQTK